MSGTEVGMLATVKWVYGVRMCPSDAMQCRIPEAFDLSFVCSSVWDKLMPKLRRKSAIIVNLSWDLRVAI